MNGVNPGVLVALVSLFGSVAAAYLSYRASSHANAVSAKKVDAEAFDRAAALYDKALQAAERETERMRSQVDRINQQLAQEQDVSNLLRNQIRALQGQVDSLEGIVAQLRRSLHEAGARKASH